MKPALVLNATYEPLSVVSARRAVILALSGKADVIHESGTSLRSERLAFAIPSVLRLRYYVKVPYGRRSALSRRGVFARDENRCQYCGGRAESIDHILPRSKGGPHTWENVVAACKRCNTNKRDRLLHETSMTLMTSPREPARTAWVELSVNEVPDSWYEYLEPVEARSA